MSTFENQSYFLKQALKRAVRRLLKVNSLQFAVGLLIVAVIVSVVIVSTIDFLWDWDGRFNQELAFAGVITPFLDGLLLIVFITAMLNELRVEVTQRETAEQILNEA